MFNLRREATVLGLCAVMLAATTPRLSAATNDLPPFEEIYKVLRENLHGVGGEELNRLAVEGFLGQLKGRVSLVSTSGAPVAAAASVGVSKTTVFDSNFGYVRLGSLASGSGEEMTKAWQGLSATNRLKGLVLDLRFADGQDYAAAAAAAEMFVAGERPLLDWGEGMVESKGKGKVVDVPVVVLVNRQTSGAAEALAAVLRDNDIGLLLGATTAGQAAVAKEVTLRDGQKLRIASLPVKVARGGPLSHEGIKPDIEVKVAPQDEAAWFADAFLPSAKTVTAVAAGAVGGSNTVASATNSNRRRLNEAELVRLQRDGLDFETNAPIRPGRAVDASKPVVTDPVLARALDLLKALAVVQRSKTN